MRGQTGRITGLIRSASTNKPHEGRRLSLCPEGCVTVLAGDSFDASRQLSFTANSDCNVNSRLSSLVNSGALIIGGFERRGMHHGITDLYG